MPYIPNKRRTILKRWYLHEPIPASTPGELNYLITLEVMDYWQMRGESYQTINDIIGALESAKQEFYRRVAVPYETNKQKINGDVY